MQESDFKMYLNSEKDATAFLQWCVDTGRVPPSGEYRIKGEIHLPKDKFIQWDAVPQKDFPPNARFQGSKCQAYHKFTEDNIDAASKFLPLVVSIVALTVVFGTIGFMIYLFS